MNVAPTTLPYVATEKMARPPRSDGPRRPVAEEAGVKVALSAAALALAKAPADTPVQGGKMPSRVPRNDAEIAAKLAFQAAAPAQPIKVAPTDPAPVKAVHARAGGLLQPDTSMPPAQSADA